MEIPETEVLRILNKYNPWWGDKPIPQSKTSSFKRGDYYIIKRELERREIVSIIGPRRVGKTILIHQLTQELLDSKIDPKRILYLSTDEVELNTGGVELKDVLEVYSTYILKSPLDSLKEPCYLFLDEIQELPNWEKILKNWYDLGYNLKFIISGSSSIWINKGTEESLLGRIKTSVMMPLKFSEVLRYRAILGDDYTGIKANLKESLVKAVQEKDVKIFHQALKELIGSMTPNRNKIEIELNRYLIIGGYPEFLDVNDYNRISESIRDKVKLIFFKDIVRYFKIRNPKVLEDLFKLLAKSSGTNFNINKTAKVLDIQRPTLKDYLKYLTKAYLIKSSEFYSQSRKARIRKQDKIYVLDAGIRNAVVDYLDDNLSKDFTELGIVAESIIFDHLIRLKFNIEPGPEPEIFYWKNSKEIDFVLPIKRKLIPIESKYRTKIPRESIEAINGFIKEKDSPFGIIITKDEFDLEDNILKIPLWVFLLVV